ARHWPTAHSKVVCFHGVPKPHEVTEGWVPMLWKAGGLTSIPKSDGINVGDDAAMANFRAALARDIPWFSAWSGKDARDCLIVGSAPRGRECLAHIRRRSKKSILISMNGSLRWLLSKGLTPDSHILLDARAENVEFARDIPKTTEVYVASQCHPDVID